MLLKQKLCWGPSHERRPGSDTTAPSEQGDGNGTNGSSDSEAPVLVPGASGAGAQLESVPAGGDAVAVVGADARALRSAAGMVV